jgi:hypothetical protein
MTIGYKKKDSHGPLYHPERDYAYITPTLLKTAIENLDAPTPELQQWKENNEISEAEIIAVVNVLADAQRDFVNGADPVDSLEKALARRDWFSTRLTVRLYLLATVGEVILGAWFKAVREVTEVGEDSPSQNEMCRFAAAVRDFTARMGAPVINANVTAEHLRLQCDLLRTRLDLMQTDRITWRSRALEAEAQLVRLKTSERRPWWKQLIGIREN